MHRFKDTTDTFALHTGSFQWKHTFLFLQSITNLCVVCC